MGAKVDFDWLSRKIFMIFAKNMVKDLQNQIIVVLLCRVSPIRHAPLDSPRA